MSKRIFDDTERDFLRKSIPGRAPEETAELFNATFKPTVYREKTVTAAQVRTFSNNNKIPNGRDTRFKKGQAAHNKGKSMPSRGRMAQTQFKKGNRPHNYKPVGSTRINVDGYTEIKVSDPKKWRCLHCVLWEAAHGPIPRGHVVIFGDGNKQNITLENLILVTRAQLVRMNQNNLIGASPEITKSGILVADLIHKLAERKRKKGRSK